MKKHNVLKVILLCILVVVVCTWIFPVISYQNGLVESERAQLGVFGLFSYFVELFRYFPYVILMVLSIGAFYGVAYKIPAYRVLLDKIVGIFKGKESFFLAITMIVIAALVSVTGMSFAILFIFPFIISVILLMGYNKLVAASVTVGATMVGILGTTFGINTTDYTFHYILKLGVYSEILTKVALLVIGLVILIYNVLLYAKKTKNGIDEVVELVPSNGLKTTKSVKLASETVEDKKVFEEVITEKEKKKDVKKNTGSSEKNMAKDAKDRKSTKTTKTAKKSTAKTKAYDLKSSRDTVVKVKNKKTVSTWPFILVFDLVVIILALATIDWTGVFGVDIFETATKAVREFTLFDFPIFDKLLGSNLPSINGGSLPGAFGEWSLIYEVPTLILLASGFLAFVYGVRFNEFISGIMNGIKKAIRPASYMLLIYLVLIVVTYHPFQLHFTKDLIGITDGFNVVTMSAIAMISSILNVETVYVAQSTLPYVTSVITDASMYPVISVIFQAIYGLMMLVAPTSVILLGTLTYLDVSYGQWLKHIWKLFLQLLLILIIVFLILVLI